MDELERYLDRVCRGIRGPRSLREHIRRELKEHLLDAIAGHRAQGLSDEQALHRALEDFGGPEEVGSDLEEQYGHRLMAVVIDKAIAWREKTMKAKWLWTTWAHVALAVVIVLEVAIVALGLVKVLPAYESSRYHGIFDVDNENTAAALTRIDVFLEDQVAAGNFLVQYWYVWALLATAAWATFEWRVQSENKSLMRLSAMGMIALGAALWAALIASALVLAYAVAVPYLYVQAPEPVVREQLARVEQSFPQLEKSLADADWKASRQHLDAVWHAVDTLGDMGGAAPALVALDQQAKIDEARAELKAAKRSLNEARNAIIQEDAARAAAALAEFRQAYGHVPHTGQ